MTPAELIAFEADIAREFEAGNIHAPVHLNSDTQAEPLIEIFKQIKRTDWVLSNWRAHWHALLHGVPRARVKSEIMAGRSMMLHFHEYRFMTSAIMGGMLPIACGLAASGERVWVFCGDMCSWSGNYKDAVTYARGQGLDVHFVIEDNGLSTNTPTLEAWGLKEAPKILHYKYKRTTPHYGTVNDGGF